MVKCGHTFCSHCLKQALDERSRCPTCNTAVPSTAQPKPNYTLRTLLSRLPSYRVQVIDRAVEEDLRWQLYKVEAKFGISMQIPQPYVTNFTRHGVRTILAAMVKYGTDLSPWCETLRGAVHYSHVHGPVQSVFHKPFDKYFVLRSRDKQTFSFSANNERVLTTRTRAGGAALERIWEGVENVEDEVDDLLDYLE